MNLEKLSKKWRPCDPDLIVIMADKMQIGLNIFRQIAGYNLRRPGRLYRGVSARKT